MAPQFISSRLSRSVNDAAPLLIKRAADAPTSEIPGAKVALEWIFAVAALSLILMAFTLRYVHLRRRGRSLNDFFSFMEPSRRPSSRARLSLSSPYQIRTPPNVYLSPSSQVVRSGTRTRGEDIDMGGRRAGRRVPDDGDLDDKDLLPAYEKRGGPPKYLDLELASVGLVTMHSPPQPTPTDGVQRDQGSPLDPPEPYPDAAEGHTSNISAPDPLPPSLGSIPRSHSSPSALP